MIESDTVVNMGFGSVMHFCLQIIIPFIVYIISVTYVSDEQSDWYNKLQTTFDANIIKGNKGLFFGSVAFILAGIASVLTITHKQNLFLYKKVARESGMIKPLDTFFDSLKTNLEFLLFPTMILFCCLGNIIGYQSRTMLPHVVLSFISAALNLYLIFSFSTSISIPTGVILIPLLVWQIANVVLYWNASDPGTETDDKSGTSEAVISGSTTSEPTTSGSTTSEPTTSGTSTS